MQGIERDGGQPFTVIGFPLVEPAVPVGIFLGTYEYAFLVVFNAVDFAVTPRGDFDAIDRALCIEE